MPKRRCRDTWYLKKTYKLKPIDFGKYLGCEERGIPPICMEKLIIMLAGSSALWLVIMEGNRKKRNKLESQLVNQNIKRFHKRPHKPSF